MPKDTEPSGVVIPDKPYGGHPAGQRWYLEKYRTEHSSMSGKSTRDLETAISNLSAIHTADSDLGSDIHASLQAAQNALRERQQGKD